MAKYFVYSSEEVDLLEVALAGEDNGLSLELNLDTQNYLMGGITESSGLKVILHTYDETPLTNSQGFSVMPRTNTKVV